MVGKTRAQVMVASEARVSLDLPLADLMITRAVRLLKTAFTAVGSSRNSSEAACRN